MYFKLALDLFIYFVCSVPILNHQNNLDEKKVGIFPRPQFSSQHLSTTLSNTPVALSFLAPSTNLFNSPFLAAFEHNSKQIQKNKNSKPAHAQLQNRCRPSLSLLLQLQGSNEIHTRTQPAPRNALHAPGSTSQSHPNLRRTKKKNKSAYETVPLDCEPRPLYAHRQQDRKQNQGKQVLMHA